MSDDKNQGGHSDFEDDFDDLEFEDIDFDEADMDTAGYEDITDEDLADDDFAGDDWDEENDPAAAAPQQGRKWGRKDKGLYTDTSERKGLNLSFNTMVIVGALLLGGSVLAYTVMSKTAEVNAGKPSAFQSMLGISSVFDGQLFGGSQEGAQSQTPTDENVTAVEQQTPQTGGLLDNPDQALADNSGDVSVVDGAPPSPMPIAPAEEDNIITPLPGDHVPRGPEEYADSPDMQLEPIVPAPAAPQRADDILKAAIANRANKDKPQEVVPAPDVVEVAPEPEIIVAEETPAPPVQTPEPVAAVPPAEKTSVEDLAKLDAAQQRAAAAEEQVKSLQQQIADLQAKLGETETALNSARSGQTGATAELQKTVDTLKADLKAANDKTTAEAKARQEAEAKATQARKDAEAAQKEATAKAAEAKKQADAAAAAKKAAQEKEAAAKKASSTASAQPAKPKAPAKQAAPARQPQPAPAAQAANVRWELRAAQPGRAWVSQLGARDMQSVQVGDTLPGVGRITAISYLSGRWVVQGTSGQIYQ